MYLPYLIESIMHMRTNDAWVELRAFVDNVMTNQARRDVLESKFMGELAQLSMHAMNGVR